MPEIALLARHHNSSRFHCGVPALNTFLKATARQHSDKGISRTFVLPEQEKPATILGYFTLTPCEVRTENPSPAYEKNILNMDYRLFALRDLLFPKNTKEKVMVACYLQRRSIGRS